MANGKCFCCNSDASVAYFQKGDIPYEMVLAGVNKSVGVGVKVDYPMMHKITVQPKILCKGCVLQNISKSFDSTDNYFKGGVASYAGDEQVVFITVNG
jgi:hypothetical protein